MKKRVSLKGLMINFIMAFAFALLVYDFMGFSPWLMATAIVATYAFVTYFYPISGLKADLQTEVWVADIVEKPLPDSSFINQSQDLSAYVNNNTLHLAEAGVDPDVHLNYFTENNDELPIQDINDIPHEVVLQIWSTSQTKHNDLLEAELSYDKRASVLNRHREALAKNMAKRTAYAWSPAESDDTEFNKILTLGDQDSVIDGIIDMQAFFRDLDLDLSKMNVILSAEHAARIRKEDKTLYKEISSETGVTLYNFKIFFYSQTPYYTASGEKKPWGATVEDTDKKASIFWSSDEVFRCTGDVEIYSILKHSGWQADLFSMGQRALNGKIRSNSPKYFGAIV